MGNDWSMVSKEGKASYTGQIWCAKRTRSLEMKRIPLVRPATAVQQPIMIAAPGRISMLAKSGVGTEKTRFTQGGMI